LLREVLYLLREVLYLLREVLSKGEGAEQLSALNEDVAGAKPIDKQI